MDLPALGAVLGIPTYRDERLEDDLPEAVVDGLVLQLGLSLPVASELGRKLDPAVAAEEHDDDDGHDDDECEHLETLETFC